MDLCGERPFGHWYTHHSFILFYLFYQANEPNKLVENYCGQHQILLKYSASTCKPNISFNLRRQDFRSKRLVSVRACSQQTSQFFFAMHTNN